MDINWKCLKESGPEGGSVLNDKRFCAANTVGIWHVSVDGIRNADKILLGKSVEKWSLGRSRRR
jgi:hypothetical protein